MTESDAIRIISGKKKELGSRLVILGHHYQNDSIIEFSDYTGDSLELSRKSAELGDAEIIVFCGVYFMAETALILSPDKKVYIPDKKAGCPLADMAKVEDIEKAWQVISTKPCIPVTYVNSSAEVKAFCGRNNGIVCTSGNAKKVFSSALEKTGRIFFMPDMNLGMNTAYSLGINSSEMAFCEAGNGIDEKSAQKAKVIMWKGWCPVHYPLFSPQDVQTLRMEHPGAKVIVHPESDPETVNMSDNWASTAGIIEYAKRQPQGSVIAVGTESNMVKRLASEKKDIRIVELRQSYCDDMGKITLKSLAVCLETFSERFRVRVPENIAADARIALKRMLEV